MQNFSADQLVTDSSSILADFKISFKNLIGKCSHIFFVYDFKSAQDNVAFLSQYEPSIAE